VFVLTGNFHRGERNVLTMAAQLYAIFLLCKIFRYHIPPPDTNTVVLHIEC